MIARSQTARSQITGSQIIGKSTVALLGVALALGMSAAAHAQDMSVLLEVVEPPEPAEDADDEDGDEDAEPQGPYFRAQIDVSRPGLTPDDFVLEDLDADPPVRQKASEVTRYRDSDQPMAMVLLVQGNFRWMGNEMYTDRNDPEAGTVYDGAFRGLGPAIDTLAEVGPSGSMASLYVYQDGQAVVRQPMGEASSLSGGALGSQRDYEDAISKPLLVGLDEAWKVLAEASGYRRVLVVLGDGTDDRADISGDLRRSIEQFRDIGAEVYTIHYVPVADDGPQGQENMRNLGFSGHYAATSRDNFRSMADTIAGQIGSRYFVTFPGDEFVFDGTTREMLVEAGGREMTQPVDVPVWERPEPAAPRSWAWLWWLLGIILLAGIVVAIVIVLKNRPAKVAAPVMEEPAAPLPQKTVMLGAGGNEDAMPIVGWIVPLSGPTQYHTFKLLHGATKLGTGGASHIYIQDSYMSTEHAEIVSSPQGFVLQDSGSTNGVYVNQQRVQSHELVDNDVFTLGQTEFKFKSIN
jgi:hypothetical protein